jgi:ribosomal protein S18 acetylase RimI-like enzyme
VGRDRAATLYQEAFRAKFRPSLGDDDRARELLAAALDPAHLLCAVRDGEVVGVLGFHHHGGSAFRLRHRDVARTWSPWTAWLRMLLLAPLDRTPRPGELLLDGVCVEAAARGHGIGTLLLDAASDLARDHGADRVRLSVVDDNPRARALYERLGFRATRTTDLGPLRHLYGFACATDMVRPVDATTEAVR